MHVLESGKGENRNFKQNKEDPRGGGGVETPPPKKKTLTKPKSTP